MKIELDDVQTLRLLLTRPGKHHALTKTLLRRLCPHEPTEEEITALAMAALAGDTEARDKLREALR